MSIVEEVKFEESIKRGRFIPNPTVGYILWRSI